MRLLLLLGLLCSAQLALTQTNLLQQTFESPSGVGADDPYTLIPAGEFINASSNNGFATFSRTDGSDISNRFSYSGNATTFFMANNIGEVDGDFVREMVFSGINISGRTDLVLFVDLAEDTEGSNPGRYNNDDFVHFTYSIDGGMEQNVLWVESSANGGSAEPAIDRDFDDLGEGREVTDVFRTFSGVIPGTGSSLTLTITFALDQNDEDIAIDNIFIQDNFVAAPVTLINLAATANKKDVTLDWSTADEVDSDFFAVERSGDNGINFREIGRLRAQGASTENTDYTYVDRTPLAGTSYYRLRQVDFDGSEEYFGPLAVSMDLTTPTLSPNPARHSLRLNTSGTATAQLFTTSGRLLREIPTASFTNIDVSDLPSGVYFLRVSNNEEFNTLRFVKE